MAAAADDDRVISGFGGGVWPLFGPALMAAKGFGEKAESAETGHFGFSIKGV
jgi:hypothetical protein